MPSGRSKVGVGVIVGVWVMVGVRVAVGVSVLVGVGVDVEVGEAVIVEVGSAVLVVVGVGGSADKLQPAKTKLVAIKNNFALNISNNFIPQL